MGPGDKSSDGDTLTERQGQDLDLAKTAVKEIKKFNNTDPTTNDVFYITLFVWWNLQKCS